MPAADHRPEACFVWKLTYTLPLGFCGAAQIQTRGLLGDPESAFSSASKEGASHVPHNSGPALLPNLLAKTEKSTGPNQPREVDFGAGWVGV
jgi:hypothetical protein